MHVLGPLFLEDKDKTTKYAADLKVLMPLDAIKFDVKYNEDSNKYFIEINQFIHGNLQTSKLDEEFLLSGEYRQIIKSAALTKNLIGEDGEISRGEKSQVVGNFHDALAWLINEAKRNLNIQRYKGLGK